MKFPVVLTFVSALLLAASALRKSLSTHRDPPNSSLHSNDTKVKFIRYRDGRNNSDGLIESRSKRNAVINPRHLWPNATIPYTIDDSISVYTRPLIAYAMEHIMNKTCIKFVRWTNEKDYVRIFKGSGCRYPSNVGRQFSGPHHLSIGNGCEPVATIIHELVHAIGFFHEQQRSDRDNHINVYKDHIKDDRYDQFAKNHEINSDNLGQPYDYHSIMHYHGGDFAKDRYHHVAMKAKNPNVVVGKKDGLTELDVKKINTLYSCSPEFARPCRDDNDQCWYWAQNGECGATCKNFMTAKCRMSCKLCESPDTITTPTTTAPTTCLDKYPACIVWAAGGFCEIKDPKDRNFVLNDCPRECNVCHV